MTVTANAGTRLAEIIGLHNVVSAPEELGAYAVEGIAPQLIACPSSGGQVAEIVRFAIAEKLAVQAFGSRSKAEIGMTPERFDISIDMTRLREVAHYDAGDLTLSVDAGMTLRELAGFLELHGQFLPLAVPCFESTTVGGAASSGIDSALRQLYGPVRDFLIGAEFVDGTGSLCKSGGRVVKNVTGYDFHKLLIGSLGTLGVITRLNFRTFPLPPSSGACLAVFGETNDVLAFRSAVEAKGLPLADLEILDPGATEILRGILQRTQEHVAELLPPGTWCAYGSCEGNAAVVARVTEELTRSAKDVNARDCTSLQPNADATLGGMLREAYEWLRWAAAATTLHRIALPQVTPTILAELHQFAASRRLRSSLLIRPAGVSYFGVLADNEEDYACSALAETALKVNQLARANRGHSTLLHAPRAVKSRMASRRELLRDEALQRRLKQAFDPANVFAPGRIPGGI